MLHVRRVQSGAMGYLSPSINEKLASYHAADLRARAEVRRLTHEARGTSAGGTDRTASSSGFDPRHPSGRRVGPPRPRRRWERLASLLVVTGRSLLVRKDAPAQCGVVIPMRDPVRAERPVVAPIGRRCDANA
jgi:hypothetical protein